MLQLCSPPYVIQANFLHYTVLVCKYLVTMEVKSKEKKMKLRFLLVLQFVKSDSRIPSLFWLKKKSEVWVFVCVCVCVCVCVRVRACVRARVF